MKHFCRNCDMLQVNSDPWTTQTLPTQVTQLRPLPIQTPSIQTAPDSDPPQFRPLSIQIPPIQTPLPIQTTPF